MSGTIARAEHALMWQAVGLMLIVVVPVIVLTLVFAWRYRATGPGKGYRPDWAHSTVIEVIVWGVPAILVAILATMVWQKTHALDPYVALPGPAPMIVQAVALDWKWLFIYPELEIATLNELAFPADRPVSFQITSNVAMNSFMIPALGGQIYAMSGMQTRLNLQADAPGRFEGRNMQFSGEGFPEQTFTVLAQSDADFAGWITTVRDQGTRLDAAGFAHLAKPSIAAPVVYFSSVPPEFFGTLVQTNMAMPHTTTNGIN